MTYVNPPVHEVGMSLNFGDRFFFSEYDIKEIHDLFRNDFPEHERTVASPGVDWLPEMGFIPLNADAIISRWWLKSSDGDLVVQVQENFLAVNWRRQVALASNPSYPGFDYMIQLLQRVVARLVDWAAKRGSGFPEPIACELLYDDLIPVFAKDGRARISDVLAFWAPGALPDRPMVGWNIGWVEPIDGQFAPRAPRLKFSAVAAAVAGAEVNGLMPVIRLNFVATSACDTMQNAWAFLQSAHDHISERFAEMIQSEVKAQWNRK